MTALVAHQPPQHPFVDAVTTGRHAPLAAGEVWDVDRLLDAGVEVVHLHFGFEHHPADVVEGWCDDLRAAGIGLVHTVHDLDNPHLTDQTDFHRTVGIVVSAADAVTTLTGAAAELLGKRYGVDAAVAPHPAVVASAVARRWRLRAMPRAGVYVHAATGRPNFDIDAVERMVARSGGRPVRVHVRPQASPIVLDRLRRLARRGRIHLEERARLHDDELWARLAGADLVLLPYRWGTHSGLLEAAHDLGTPVLAPSFGGYGDQGATTYDDDPGPLVAEAASRRPRVTAASRRRDQVLAGRVYAAAYATRRVRVAR